jgi:Tol biopolymer transport system component
MNAYDHRARRGLPALLAAAALAILLSGGGPAGAAFPGANGKIAFVDSDGDAEIFVMDPDGSNVTQLTSNAVGDVQPAWSPDGTKIAFASARGDDGEIVVMDADGSNEVQLTSNGVPDAYPAWSPDGTKITFTRELTGDPDDPDHEIFVMNADGSGQTQLTSDDFGKFGSEWSPDGTKIAFHRERGASVAIVVMNADGTGQIDISPASQVSDFNPSWSPDGTKIAFNSFQAASGIFTMNADGSGRTRLTSQPDLEPAWSPDGTKIVFGRNEAGGTRVFVMNADGSGQTPLHKTKVFLTRPDWQPLPGSSDFDWTMPSRYGADGDGDGLIDSFEPDPPLLQVDPGGFQVDFAGSGDACGVSVLTRWRIEGVEVGVGDPNVVAGNPHSCTFSYLFAREGSYEVALEGRDGSGNVVVLVTHVVPVQDYLIVSIGDSVASGEGNPDVPGAVLPEWQSEQCHRSALAGPARAARAVEQADQRTSVTFLHLACSGATINDGLLGSYDGIEPGAPLPPQVDQLQDKDLVGDREIDAVLVSIGANDVKFSTVVELCLLKDDCDVLAPGSAASLFEKQLAFLPGRYVQLGAALDGARVRRERTYISEYFDPTRHDTGIVCDRTILGDAGLPERFSITEQEATWASTSMMPRLNAAVQGAASAHGWRYVGGIVSDFLTHGYCADNHWVVRLTEALANQGDKEGTLHPNAPGQGVYGGRISGALTPDLWAGGNLQSPRRPQQRLEAQGKRASDPGFLDIVEGVQPGETVTIRIRVQGPDNDGRIVSLALDGPGSLSAMLGTTNASGEVTVTYTAPDPFVKDRARVVATFLDGVTTFRDTVGITLDTP